MGFLLNTIVFGQLWLCIKALGTITRNSSHQAAMAVNTKAVIQTVCSSNQLPVIAINPLNKMVQG